VPCAIEWITSWPRESISVNAGETPAVSGCLAGMTSPGYVQPQPSFDHEHHERRGGWRSSKEASAAEAEEGKHVLKAKLAGTLEGFGVSKFRT
jgi:hypothetical protein